jgi:superfamily I DNA/RNA helicase
VQALAKLLHSLNVLIFLLKAGVPVKMIVVFSFTRKAIQSIRQRLKLANTLLKDVRVYTFHSYCLPVMHHKPDMFGLRNNFSVINEEFQQELITQLWNSPNSFSASLSIY